MNKLPLTLVLIFCLRLLAFSQNDTAQLTTIASKLQKLTAARPAEKVYLQFNKPGYTIGDTIWFKGYVTVGNHHQPSALSAVLYVDLIDTKDKIIRTLMLKNNNGVSAGDFVLDSKLPAGDYHIRAYTNWMRNFGPDQFFTQAIPVGDTRTSALLVSPSFAVANVNNEEAVNTKLAYTDESGKPFINRQVNYQVRADTNLLYAGTGVTDASGNLAFTFPGKTAPKQHIRVISHLKLTGDVGIDKTTSLTVPNENMDIQFFPEGGELVNGVRSKVAFKAVGTNGLGVSIKGTIVDNDNNEVAEFTSQHAGMGVFALMPMPGKTYSAKIMLADNLFFKVKLPVANDKGFVLAVNTNPNDSTKLNVRVTTNEATLNEKKGQSFYIAGQSGETIYYTTAGKLNNGSFSAIVPKSKFPSGIAQFTLFSNTNEPLNERMVFIKNNNDILNLDLETQKQIYAPKEQVNLALNAKDNTGKPVQGNFSLTVYNEDKLTANENAESTILSNLLLTSDLKGYVEEPDYYFSYPSAQTNADLDVLLLTQGYRRFEWKEVIDDSFPKITYQPEKGLSISGTLTTEKGKPLAKARLNVLATAAKTLIDTTADEHGRFVINNVEFTDSTKLVVEARTANDGKNVIISLDNNRTVPAISKNVVLDVSPSLVAPLFSMVTDNKVVGNADTTRIAAGIIAGNTKPAKALKEVTIKSSQPDKPDKSNLYGSKPPEKIISGDKMREYAMTKMGIETQVPNVSVDLYGKIFDMDPRTKKVPMPIVLDDRPLPVRELNFDIDNYVDADQIENVKVLRGNEFKTLYNIPVSDPNNRILLITTKKFAGTDTARITTGIIANTTKPAKALKEVTIKSRQPDKPDKSNLYGSKPPEKIISGDKMGEMSMTLMGLENNVPGLHVDYSPITGLTYLYDTNPLVKEKIANMDKSFRKTPDEKLEDDPIPIVLNGTKIDYVQDIDALVDPDQIEDVKILRGDEFKTLYGVSATNGNDRIILITTKKFAGTDTVDVRNTAKNKLKQLNLKEVDVKARKNAGTELAPWILVDPNSANLNGPGHANTVFGPKDLELCIDVITCVINKLPGIIRKTVMNPAGQTVDGVFYAYGDEIDYFSRHMGQSLTSPPPIKFLLDGAFVNYDNLTSLDVNSISSVEVLESSSYLNVYGSSASGGMLIFTTKKGTAGYGEDNNNQSTPGLITTKFKGYYKAREFYMPKYTAANLNNTDTRDAVYWNANIVTDSNGKFPVEYFNSDVKGAYRAVVEGIDNDGNIGRFVYRYRVE